MKVITTVRGDMEPEQLGFTLSHEHLIQDMGVFSGIRQFLPPVDAKKTELKNENMRFLWGSGAFYNEEVLRCDTDEYLEMIINEVAYYKEAGGSSIIECSVQGLNGRPFTDLVTISEKTGVHIIAGLGFYTAATMPKECIG